MLNNHAITILGIARASMSPSLKSTLWLLRMIIPITLFVGVMDYYGLLEVISGFTAPLFEMLGLPAQAALVFITSSLTSIYSAIAVMGILDLGLREVTILASMCLISHNLIVEGVIQAKSGASFWRMTLIRVVFALVCGFLLNLLMPMYSESAMAISTTNAKMESLWDAIENWGVNAAWLALQILVIVYLLTVLQGALREFKIIGLITRYLTPLMLVMGLPRSTAFLWVLANTLGLAYGGALIVQEIQSGGISKKDAALFNTSVASTHSLLEDTLLFIAIGVGLWWLVLPRLVFSIGSVWVQRFFVERRIANTPPRSINSYIPCTQEPKELDKA